MPKTTGRSGTRRRPSSIKTGQPDWQREFPFRRHAGIALGGGKTDRTALVLLDFYPNQGKLFVSKTLSKLEMEGAVTSDQALLQALSEQGEGLESVTLDAPLSLPPCFQCQCGVVDFSRCSQAETQWMWRVYRERAPRKRPNKMFTPYTERAAEIYIQSFLEERFYPHHVMGSNQAPLTARALYLAPRLSGRVLEHFPPLTLWRIGRSLRLSGLRLRFYRHSSDGEEARLYFLRSLVEKDRLFIYQQDIKALVENCYLFEALLGALAGHFEQRGQSEPRPPDFPAKAAWPSFPKTDLKW